MPYQEDLGAALQALRAAEFASGDYCSPTEWGMPAPATVEELFENELYWEFLGTNGTHSVLDVGRVISADEHHGFGTVRPLAASVVQAGFGTDKPSRANFDAMDSEALDALDQVPRWSGCCMVLYQDGIPDGIAFWGVSGD